MKRILLVYPPFCTPASPPYSITALHSFLKANCSESMQVLDLNLEFHKLKFPTYQEYYQDSSTWKDYDKITNEYHALTSKVYSENNKLVVRGLDPELLDDLVKKIRSFKPDIVAFSIVYSSQAFYTYALIRKLKDLKCVVGGPAVNSKLASIAHQVLANERELLEYITGKKDNACESIPDFSIFPLQEYFTPKPVIPIKTSTTCYYQKCAFCSHFSKVPYREYPLELIRQTIVASKQQYFYLIDDMIPRKRLLAIAKTMKPLNVKWACQLRPSAEFDYQTLITLRESGLTVIMWGVESGNNRVLKLINKGTDVDAISKVLADSHKAGIKNVAYVIVGFPTETEIEFAETASFLKQNSEFIDMVSLAVFGLQKGTIIYDNPAKFSLTGIVEHSRTILDPRLTYQVSHGLTHEEAIKLRRKYMPALEKINKYPRAMNFFREHLLCLVE
ncbi:MAG: B12-binding domain-containing radical SAM protein [Candidatus Woesearchaeota archaeon]